MKILATSALAIAAVLFAGSAQAQAQQPAAVQHGAPIAGVCALNLQGVFARSTAGQGLNTRLQELQQEIAGELAPYQQTIEAEDQALSGAGASLSDTERQQRGQALQQRFAEFQQLRQTRLQELEYTEFMQRRALGAAVDPIVAAVYQERGCSILLNRAEVFYLNPQMEISELVLQRLNQQLPSLPAFNRMPVPVQQQQ
ncbi:OmpH family outer membrane protein [Brevundimonas viscosa]|uniref:Periplasmic chaperone for outer membrane proteins Skp n=1 Tax=Brevundimonas viscosa TaxID=871741 RepID=A0A1I6S8I3_9CAUL|nr:OmpH family outer membrane protein [Brevundimonas viscosa]SFS73275.1 periplasmic chaperone for outer membrane proteins Skp [Brevundimonas viscosa]